jgi:hypothetical protein
MSDHHHPATPWLSGIPVSSGSRATSPSSSPWSLEHYGFVDDTEQLGPAGDVLPAPGVAQASVAPPTSPASSTAATARRVGQPPAPRRSRRIPMLIASGALALGLTAGGAGIAAAQASTGHGGPDRTVVTQLAGDRGHVGNRGDRR